MAEVESCKLEVRFWAKVEKTDNCWEWIACRDKDGYGSLTGKRAHRISWELHFGKIPEGLCVLHSCDNRICVKPSHLFLGTRADNMKDMARKGRSCFGERNRGAKLKTEDILAIKRALSLGESCASLGRQFGVRDTAINKIKLGHKWKHLLDFDSEARRVEHEEAIAS